MKCFFASFFCLPLFLTVGTLTSDFKDNKSLKSRKDVEIKVCFNFCLLMGSTERIRIWIREAQKLTDPENTDRCNFFNSIMCIRASHDGPHRAAPPPLRGVQAQLQDL
jgi:hypothetical protein